ncbi:hypothetical protein F441_04640 [Phytophthora nicotianae CJ01A1]|uniref:BZIP domain-containing protein n=2 Tax=Phytophthora nicotianae TaxID=4792 RepID=W2XGF1_PHYNI|nr:hypothetical protein L915_04538 [Phytophthora nicotianae]ETP21975.1 hypothetical protein F441_04640 [Phytophthora nicotianae CJ01A1]
MHCHRASVFERPIADAVRVLHLENEFRRLAPAARFRVGGQVRPQLWDAMMRGLKHSEMSTDAASYARLLPPQLGPQQPEEEHDNDNDDSCAAVVKRSKTNSERGRAFRARRKKYEDDLLAIVNSLRQEVEDLGFLRGVRADKVLYSRNSMGGSLVRLTRAYFSMFEYGMPSVRGVGQKRPAMLTDVSIDSSDESLEAKQKAFLDSAMDLEVQFGEASGPKSLLDQWKRYTSYHSSISVVVVGVEVSGEEDSPMVTVRSDLHVVFSQDTFDNVFPHAADNEELVNKFIGREVVYHGVNRFQFSPQGQILIYDSDVGFVDALVQAGASVSDIALLMQQARIADECRLGDEGKDNNRVQELDQENQDLVEYYSGAGTSACVTDADSDADAFTSENNENDGPNDGKSRPPQSSRHAIDFLLS